MTKKRWIWIVPLVLITLAAGLYMLAQPRLPYGFLGQHRIARTWKHGPWTGYLIEGDLHAVMNEADAEFVRRKFPRQNFIAFPHLRTEEFSRTHPDVWFSDNVKLVGDPPNYAYTQDKEGGKRKAGYCLFFCLAPEPSFIARASNWLRGLFHK